MKNVLLTILFLFFTAILFSQNSGAIKGKVLDNELVNEPLIFANVHIKDTSWKTRTNFNGNFEMEDVAPGSYTLVIGFAGYESLEIPIEVKQNEVTEVHKGLAAKSINLGEIASTDSGTKKIQQFYPR